MDYVTGEQVASLGHEFDPNNDRTALLVTAASRLFDKQVGVPDDFFAEGDTGEDPAYTNRDFIGNGTAYLKLDPYIALNPTDPITINNGTILVPNYSTTNVPDYVMRNGSLVVIDRTLRRGFSSTGINRYVGWPDGAQIRVSANWGFSEIPADVSIACAHIAIALYRTADPAISVISNAEGAATRIETIPKVARDIITENRAKYSRQPIFV